ncbi:MAG: LEPR-XLL domain-containing protein, partial [Burkholderiaceae bacterium]
MTARKNRRWANWRPQANYKKNRVQVEKLEDRILLSADPLVKLDKNYNDDPIAADNVKLSLNKPSSSSFDLNLLSRGGGTVIDLTKDPSQNSQWLAWDVASQRMTLTQTAANLIIDLGDKSTALRLFTNADGLLELQADNLYDLVLSAPTTLLGIRGGAGIDTFTVEDFDLGNASLVLEAEKIELSSGYTVETNADVVFRGHAKVSSTDSSVTLSLESSVKVQGSITAGGAVILDAKGEISATKEFVGVATSMNIQSTSQVQALVGSGAVIQAETLSVLASTESLLSATAKGGLGVIALKADQTTSAKVAGGATITLGETADTAVTSLLVQAIDRSSIVNSLNTADSLVTALTAGFDLGISTIDVYRATTAQLGDDALKTSKLTDGT